MQYFASRFNSVEVNYTFRSPAKLTPDLAARWIADVPEGFRFSFKAPWQTTHSKERLQKSDILNAFWRALKPFSKAGRMGCVLFQLPPTFKYDAKLLRSFLRKRMPYPAAFEFRHESWFNDETYDILKVSSIALCVAESDELTTPDIATANHVYYRFRLSKYGKAVLAQRAECIVQHLNAGRVVYAYQKHEESAVTPRRARTIAREVDRLLHS